MIWALVFSAWIRVITLKLLMLLSALGPLVLEYEIKLDVSQPLEFTLLIFVFVFSHLMPWKALQVKQCCSCQKFLGSRCRRMWNELFCSFPLCFDCQVHRKLGKIERKINTLRSAFTFYTPNMQQEPKKKMYPKVLPGNELERSSLTTCKRKGERLHALWNQCA